MIRLAQHPFLSVQGEGSRTGVLTIFVRFFGCNLRCGGFYQKHPTQPLTWIYTIEEEPKNYKSLDSVPIIKYGCDTLYAIDPRFKHLAITYDSVEQLWDEILALLPKKDGKPSWIHPDTGNKYDLCFTGGEPLLHQDTIAELISLEKGSKWYGDPNVIQIETNGTQELNDSLYYALANHPSSHTQFNVSPKLFNVSGELKEKTWFPEHFKKYNCLGKVDLKFVVNETAEAFDELDERVSEVSHYNIYVMPVGSTFEQQNNHEVINKIAKMAIERGYHISGRLHCTIFGNSHDR